MGPKIGSPDFFVEPDMKIRIPGSKVIAKTGQKTEVQASELALVATSRKWGIVFGRAGEAKLS